MSNIIEFLEKLGQDSQLRHAGREELEGALREAGIEPVASGTVLGADRTDLERLLDARTNVCCLIHSSEDEEEGPLPKQGIALRVA